MKRFLEVGSLNLLRKQFVKPNAPQVSRQDAFPRVEGVLGTLCGDHRGRTLPKAAWMPLTGERGCAELAPGIPPFRTEVAVS